MNAWMIVFVCVFVGLFLAVIIPENFVKQRDIPKVLSPVFVECVNNHGKIGLIDRSSSEYNPRALVDGSLSECGV